MARLSVLFLAAALGLPADSHASRTCEARPLDPCAFASDGARPDEDAVSSCGTRQRGSRAAPAGGAGSSEFANPEPVTIQNYSGDAMEPFISRDGHYLFFNTSNAPSVDTNLQYAERVDDVTFSYRGELSGANSPALDAVATMDRDGNFYFVSSRSYSETLSTIYRGRFSDGELSDVAIVEGLSKRKPGHVNFDVEVSADGDVLYFVDGVLDGGPLPKRADLAISVRRGTSFRRSHRSAKLLRNVNTSALEYAASVSADELELFFTRTDTAGPAIFHASRTKPTKPFGQPVRVTAADGFVEAPSLSADGRSLYYHKREGDRSVIYRVTRLIGAGGSGQIVFVAPGIPGGDQVQELFSMKLDGSNRSMLTSDGKSPLLPHFAPDGRRSSTRSSTRAGTATRTPEWTCSQSTCRPVWSEERRRGDPAPARSGWQQRGWAPGVRPGGGDGSGDGLRHCAVAETGSGRRTAGRGDDGNACEP